MSDKTNQELDGKCSDVFVREELFRCRADWNCPNKRHYESKRLCGVEGNLDTETKIEYVIKDANKDLSEKKYKSAGRKYKLASQLEKLERPLDAEQVKTLVSYAYRSIDDNRIDDFVPQVGMSGRDPENFLRDLKDMAKETALKTESENGMWIKRYERIHEWLDEYYTED